MASRFWALTCGLVTLAAAAGALVRGCSAPAVAPAAAGDAPSSASAPLLAPPPAPPPREPGRAVVPPETAPAPAPPATPAPSAASIVRVLGREEGAAAPIAGARVRVVGIGRTEEAMTDASGRAEIVSVPARPAALWARADGWAPARIESPSLGEAPVEVVLARGARVRIVWRTPRSEPIAATAVRAALGPAAEVAVLDGSVAGGRSWWGDASPLRSDAASWQFAAPLVWSEDRASLAEPLAPGRWTLLVPRPGLPPGLVHVTVPAGAAEVDAAVEVPGGAGVRRVKLLDEKGAALSGASVRPWHQLVRDFAFAPGPAWPADAAGVVALPRAEPGGARVVWCVESPTHAGEVESAALEARPDEDPLVVRCREAARIEGTAFAAAGVPAAGAAVSWTSRAGPSRRAICDAAGRFVLAGVSLRRAAQESVSLALLLSSETRFHAVEAAAGGTTRVVLGPADAGTPAGSVTGRVTAAGAPLGGVQVVVAPAAEPRTLLSAATSPDGSFSFPSVPAGTARLRVLCGDPRVSDAARIVSAVPFAVGAGDAVRQDLDLPDAAVRAVVVDAASGAPLPYARVVARPSDDGGLAGRFPGATFVPGWSALTDASGAAFLPGLVPAVPHRLEVVDADGRAATVEDVRPGTVASPAEVRIAVRP